MFDFKLRHQNHIREYSITPSGVEGWEVRLEEDRTLRRLDHYRDWHRVERAMAAFAREVEALRAQGWRVAERGAD